MTTTDKRPLKVFLCHAHSDKDVVKALYARLTKDGVDAWLDKEKLLPGQDWELEIRKAVREADVVVVCLSKQFNQAGFRQKEVRLALDTAMEKPEGEIFIIPARLEECDTLESLRKWHWVDLFEWEGYGQLRQALTLCAQKVGASFERKLALKIHFKKSEAGMFASTLVQAGDIYQATGKFTDAINCYQQALTLSREMGDKSAERIILSNLGALYEDVGDFVAAIEYTKQALQLDSELSS